MVAGKGTTVALEAHVRQPMGRPPVAAKGPACADQLLPACAVLGTGGNSLARCDRVVSRKTLQV